MKQMVKHVLESYQSLKLKRAYKNRVGAIRRTAIDDPKHVLIITIDCLRNDHLSRMGYERQTTPFLDSLSSGAAAISAAPWTFSSVPSILSGLYPHQHGAVCPTDGTRNQVLSDHPHGIDTDVVTLGEQLGAAGYNTRFDTAISTAAIPMRGRFETIVEHHNDPAQDVLEETRDWWEVTTGPKFAHVQLGDLHEPLDRSVEPFFGEVPDIEGVRRWRFGETASPRDKFEAYREARVRLYDNTLRQIDREIELFVSSLDDRENTIVVVTSDHGEEFWECRDLERAHFEDPRGVAGVGHGHALVRPVIEVPILSNSLEIESGGEFSSTIDIMPSVLDDLGAEFDGQNDAELLSNARRRPPLCQEIAYGPNQISVTAGDEHLIVIPARDDHMLLEYHSGEITDDEQRVEELMEYLPPTRRVGTGVTLSSETVERLKDLGYQ